MENSGFRIIEVSIEGFKGFTKKQTLSVDGKHLFLLGPNGYGKSSVLEAIRWGLFGSTRRPGETVLNQNYPGACRVELALSQGGKSYLLRRTLLRGVTGGNDARLFDEAGQEQNLGEVMPQLDSAAAGEAMHLVFTAQAAKQKRAVEDLKPFERTVYTYLGLTDVRLAIGQLDKFVFEQDAMLNNLGKKFGEAEHRLDIQVAAVEDARDAILANPPWGDEMMPTVEQTRQKLLVFGKELAPLLRAAEPLDNGDIDTLCHIAERYVAQASLLGKTAPTQELAQVESKIGRLREVLEKLRVASSKLMEARSTLKATEEELRDSSGGKTVDQVEMEFGAANKHLEKEAATENLKQLAATLLSGSNVEGESAKCPVCYLPMEKDAMLKIISEAEGYASNVVAALTSERNRLKSMLDQILALKSAISIKAQTVLSCENAVQQSEKGLAPELQVGPGVDLGAEAAKRLEVMGHQVEALKKQIENAKEADQLRRSTLLKLQDETKLHRLLRQHRGLQAKREESRRAKENLASLMGLRETTSKIRGAMESGLLAELKASLGPVDKALSESFVALTQHPAYDRAFVDPDLLPKLELKVGSTEDPKGKWDDSVLNGQATSALGLVPYFAFSQLTDMPFEVHVMLLDDPTQSFDREHIETLVAKLAQVGQKVQLVLSSHELLLFKEFIKKYFPKTSHRIVELTKFSIKDGPAI